MDKLDMLRSARPVEYICVPMRASVSMHLCRPINQQLNIGRHSAVIGQHHLAFHFDWHPTLKRKQVVRAMSSARDIPTKDSSFLVSAIRLRPEAFDVSRPAIPLSLAAICRTAGTVKGRGHVRLPSLRLPEWKRCHAVPPDARQLPPPRRSASVIRRLPSASHFATDYRSGTFNRQMFPRSAN